MNDTFEEIFLKCRKFETDPRPNSNWRNCPKDLNKYIGFVYVIENTTNGRQYIGKKFFWRTEKKSKKITSMSGEELKRLTRYTDRLETLKTTRAGGRISDIEKALVIKIKDYKNQVKEKNRNVKQKKHFKVESDWEDYWGSSEELLADMKTHGRTNFRKAILYCCDNKFECTYLELYEQMRKKVLFTNDYYNKIVNVRLRRG